MAYLDDGTNDGTAMTGGTMDIGAMIAAQGPVGTLIAGIDDPSPLGKVSTWSANLISTVRLMLSSKAEIVLFWGPELCALYNEAYAPTIGDKHPAAIGRPAREYWAELWDDLGPLLHSVLDTGETVHAKDRAFYIERDGGRGENVYFDISYSPVFEADGSIGGVLCIVSETTQRVMSEREMLADRNRLWALARDPFLIADRDGVWRAASPAWTDILGWTQEDLIGRTSQWMEHPDDQESVRREVDSLAGGQMTTRFETRFRGVDGHYRTFSWTAVPEGELIYCVARDVTEHRAESRAREEAESALRQAQKMETLGQLTGGVAHDFNNMLQVVTGNLDLLQRALPKGDKRLRRMVERAAAGADRATVLTQRLLAFSRRQPLAPRPIDPNALIIGMSDLFHRTLGEMVEVITLSASDPWLIEVDANQLENALLNLAVNARDAMPDGGTLTIEVINAWVKGDESGAADNMSPGPYVMINLSDTGEGMDAQTLARAIEPFFTTKEVGRGTGLGLSMVYGFTKQSGGHMTVVSELGKGTRITLCLPHHEGQVANDNPVIGSQETTPIGGHETILLCEDDDQVRIYSVAVLRELGYRVIASSHAADALAAMDATTEPIDLLFTDVILPGGMTGADLARAAQARQPDLRTLFTTGYARDTIVHDGRLDAGVDLLSKPFSYDELASKVRAALDRMDDNVA